MHYLMLGDIMARLGPLVARSGLIVSLLARADEILE